GQPGRADAGHHRHRGRAAPDGRVRARAQPGRPRGGAACDLEPARPGAGGLRHQGGAGRRGRGEGGGAAEEPVVINAGFVTLVLAALGFGYRLLAGPTLAGRVVGLDGLLVVGVSAVALRAMATGEGAFLPVAVVVGLVGFVSTSVVGRYIEGR